MQKVELESKTKSNYKFRYSYLITDIKHKKKNNEITNKKNNSKFKPKKMKIYTDIFKFSNDYNASAESNDLKLDAKKNLPKNSINKIRFRKGNSYDFETKNEKNTKNLEENNKIYNPLIFDNFNELFNNRIKTQFLNYMNK